MNQKKSCEIMYGVSSDYISGYDGQKIFQKHPTVLLSDERYGTFLFICSHDDKYGIGNEVERRKYAFKCDPEMSKTKIRNIVDLKLARNYFYEIANDKNASYEQRSEALKMYNNVKLGTVCYRPVEKNIAFLEQKCPHFETREGYKFSWNKTNEKRALNEYERQDILKNAIKYKSMLVLIEKALLNNKFEQYSEKDKNSDGKIESHKIPFEERVKLAYEVRCEKNFIEKTEKVSLIEYVENLKEKVTNEKAVAVLDKIENECKLKEKELKVELLDAKLSNLDIARKELYKISDKDEMLNKYMKIREVIAKTENEKVEAIKELKEYKEELEGKEDGVEKEKKEREEVYEKSFYGELDEK